MTLDRAAVGVLAFAGVLACAAPDDRPARTSDSAAVGALDPRPLPPDSLLLQRFQAFLDSSVVTRLDSGAAYVGRPERCEADGIVPQVNYLLAAGRALGVVHRSPDAATVRAELTVVAEDSTSDAGGRRVLVGVRTDTVDWDLVRDSAGTWDPCGYASTSRDIGPMGTGSLPATWDPAEAGWSTIARLVDSVRRGRGMAP